MRKKAIKGSFLGYFLILILIVALFKWIIAITGLGLAGWAGYQLYQRRTARLPFKGHAALLSLGLILAIGGFASAATDSSKPSSTQPTTAPVLQPKNEASSSPALTSSQTTEPASSQNTSAQATTIPTIKTTVTRVVDGDTFHVTIDGKDEAVRLIGVDTPETHDPNKSVQPYGPEAENFTRSNLEGKTIYLEKDVQGKDKYGRLLMYAWLEQPSSSSESEVRSKMYNAKLLLEGYAQVMTIPPNVKYSELFVKLAGEARDANKGIWGLSTSTSQSLSSSQSNPSSPSTSSSSTRRGNGPGPHGETIKGNINSKGEKIYHVPGGQFYDKTIPERWFFTEEEAQAAGFRRSKR